MKSFLFLLSIIGCCAGQNLLPQGPVEAVLGKNVTFKTLVELKHSFSTFVWYFNRGSGLVPIITVTPSGETVAEGYQGRLQVNRTNGFLTLGPLDKKDRGYYNATMITSKMKRTGETMLRVLGCCEWYALPEGPLDAVSGKNVTFKTLIDPKEEFNATAWFFSNGGELMRVATMSRQQESVVFKGYQGRVTVNQANGFLTLGPLATTDNGDYYVNILTAKGVKTGEMKLRVLEPVSNVTIRAKVSETVEFNSTVVLTCSAKGSFLKFSWTSGTAPIMADNARFSIAEEAMSSMLTISGIRSTDLVGPIYCTAANQLEIEKSALFNLTVIYPPTPSVPTLPAQPGLPEKEEEGGEPRPTSSYTTISPYTTLSSHTSSSSRTTTSSHTTTSPYTTTTQRDRDKRLDNKDFLEIRVWFDKLQAELVEMRLSFERSLRQMESRTHSLLWSMSRRLERMTEAMDRNSYPSHQTKTYLSLRRLLSKGVLAVTPSSQPPGSCPMSLHTRGQRKRGGRRGNRS